MAGIWSNLAVVLGFVLLGGLFAAAEIALISVRESRIEALRETKPRQAARVARLVSDPNRLLASVQVGVTLAGVISAGFGAAQIAPSVAPWLEDLGLPEGFAAALAFIAVTFVIAYLSLVLGELVPKRLALQRAEGVALHLAGPVDVLASLSKPFIWVLSVSTDVVVRLLGGDPDTSREQITSEELRGLVASHEEFSQAERELIDDVFEAGQRQLREVMIPRTEVEFLSKDMPVFRAVEHVSALPFSRYPVIGDSPDDVLGFIHVRDLLAPSLSQRSIRLGSLAREVARLPGSKPVLAAMSDMRSSTVHLAIVEDEYGGTDGIVTLEDLVEEVIGDIRDEFDAGEFSSTAGLREYPGLMNLEDFAEASGIELPEGPYETLAGWLVFSLGRLPMAGDSAQLRGARFEVLSLDGRRIDRVAVSLPAVADSDGPAPPTAAPSDHGREPA